MHKLEVSLSLTAKTNCSIRCWPKKFFFPDNSYLIATYGPRLSLIQIKTHLDSNSTWDDGAKQHKGWLWIDWDGLVEKLEQFLDFTSPPNINEMTSSEFLFDKEQSNNLERYQNGVGTDRRSEDQNRFCVSFIFYISHHLWSNRKVERFTIE